MSFQEFIDKAKVRHNNRYDYSNSVFLGYATPLTIICPQHGEFSQLPKNHLKGSGCPKCVSESHGRKLARGTDKFIKKADTVHDHFYDYSQVVYTNSFTKVTIICPEHGAFDQAPEHHLQGRGCRKCGIVQHANKTMAPFSEFVKKARDTHKEQYQYSTADYQGYTKKTTIICSIHGPFRQMPNAHLSGSRCPKCSHMATVKSAMLGKEEFIRRSRLMHGEKYDYQRVCYNGSQRKVEIICPIHGSFNQLAFSHMKGKGCGLCAKEENRKKRAMNFVKKANDWFNRRYDYSQMEYINNNTKITIICPIHGPFRQTPDGHLNSTGCKLCGEELRKLGFGGEKITPLNLRR